MYEDLGLTRKEDISDELRPCNLRKSSKDLSKLLDSVTNSMHSFNSEVNKVYLFNISIDKAAKDKTADFLLNVRSIGKTKRESFIPSCYDDQSNFGNKHKDEDVCYRE